MHRLFSERIAHDSRKGTAYAWAVKCAKQAGAAAKKAGVRRAVVVSSMGAHTGPGTGAVGPAREIENDFEAALPAVVSLRPGIFMENFLLSTDMIAKAGQIFVPIPAGKRWPLVATTDIADKAACWLLDRGWSGHHRVGVHGPKDLSTDEAAAIISSALGEPVKCVDATLDQARGAMKGMGMPDFVVDLIIEQYGAFREGGARIAGTSVVRANSASVAWIRPSRARPARRPPRHPQWRSIGRSPLMRGVRIEPRERRHFRRRQVQAQHDHGNDQYRDCDSSGTRRHLVPFRCVRVTHGLSGARQLVLESPRRR